jgi:hypothetical protein
MITVLIWVSHGPEALAITLSALVPAVAEGLVADAVVLTDGSDGDVARVAEAAGATLVTASAGSWAEGARVARHQWLLCLDDGDLPQEGWIRVLDRFVSLSRERHQRARLGRRERWQRAVRGRIDRLLFPSAIRSGDLLRRERVLDGAGTGAAIRLGAAIERDPAFS